MFWCARNLIRSGASKHLQTSTSTSITRLVIRNYSSENDGASDDGKKPQSSSTVDIKKLLQQFDQKFQPGSNVNKDTATTETPTGSNIASPSNTGGNSNNNIRGRDRNNNNRDGNQTSFNIDENDDTTFEQVQEEMDTEEAKRTLERVLVEESEDTPYLFDPKMIREYNRYQAKAVPADLIDNEEDMELIEIISENEPIDPEVSRMVDEEFEAKFGGQSNAEIKDVEEDQQESGKSLAEKKQDDKKQQLVGEEDIDEDGEQFGEEADDNEPICDNSDLFQWIESVEFDETNPEQLNKLYDMMGEDRLADYNDLREYMIESGHNPDQYSVVELLEIMEMGEEELVDLVEEDIDRYELEDLDLEEDLKLEELKKYAEDDEGNPIEGQLSDAYIKYGRDYFDLQVDRPVDQDTLDKVEQGEAARSSVDDQAAKTLYDEENVGEDYFLAEDTPYDEKEVEELSKELDKEPIFEYEIDLAKERLTDRGMLDDFEHEIKDDLDFEAHVYELVAKRLGIAKLPAGLSNSALDNMSEQQFAALIKQMNLEQFEHMSESEVNTVIAKALEGVVEDLEKEYEKKSLSAPKSNEKDDESDDAVYIVEDDNDEVIEDTTTLFDIDDQAKELNVHNTAGLVQITDLAENIIMEDEVNGTSYKDDLRVLGMEADMYLRRNQRKMKVLAKRRENAAKYREATLKKNRENPQPKQPYQRQQIPTGENVFTTPMAPNTFVRLKSFEKDDLSSTEQKPIYNSIIDQSNRIMSANGYYTQKATKQSLIYIRNALASYKPHLNSRRQQIEDSTLVKDPRFEKNKAIIVEPWQLPRHNPEYYSFDDRDKN